MLKDMLMFDGMTLSLQIAQTQEELDYVFELDAAAELRHNLTSQLLNEQAEQFELLGAVFGENRGQS